MKWLAQVGTGLRPCRMDAKGLAYFKALPSMGK
jgi:hypothetical protein